MALWVAIAADSSSLGDNDIQLPWRYTALLPRLPITEVSEWSWLLIGTVVCCCTHRHPTRDGNSSPPCHKQTKTEPRIPVPRSPTSVCVIQFPPHWDHPPPHTHTVLWKSRNAELCTSFLLKLSCFWVENPQPGLARSSLFHTLPTELQWIWLPL